jgi:hypothetical protein
MISFNHRVSVWSFRKLLLLSGCFLLYLNSGLNAQDIAGVEETGIVYRNVRHIGLAINSTGVGIHYRRGKHLTGYSLLMGDFSFSNLRDPKEVRSVNPFSDNSGGYHYGKLNSLYTLHAGIGKQKTINAKGDRGGVEIGFGYYAGFSAGILKPVYLTIFYVDDQDGGVREKVERYDPAKHYPDNISGKASLFKGIGESKIRPGVYGAFLVNFEWGKEQQKIRMIETGVTLDVFPLPVEVMAYNQPSSYFMSLFIRVIYGRQWNR